MLGNQGREGHPARLETWAYGAVGPGPAVRAGRDERLKAALETPPLPARAPAFRATIEWRGSVEGGRGIVGVWLGLGRVDTTCTLYSTERDEGEQYRYPVYAARLRRERTCNGNGDGNGTKHPHGGDVPRTPTPR